ncbi:ABC transporter substrate-binding protein [Ferrovibrio sp.]|uniref:ABC transporter substrate-binding protein n=1 Tax=Ferrovibrio sp. TaxID=1917215 RepID=UPI0035B28A5B
MMAALAAGGFSLATAAAEAQTNSIVVGLPVNISMGYATMTAAMELGYFKEEGLEVKLQEFQGAAIVLQQLAGKNFLIGGGGADPLILVKQPGRDAPPVRFFYNSSRDYIWEYVVPENSPIKTLQDLRGKKIGVGSLSNSHVPVTRQTLKEAGLELTKDYQLMAIGIGGPAFRALLNGDVDAYNTWQTNIAGFEATGTKLRRLPMPQKYKDLFTVGYMAHEDTIKNNPKALIGAGRGFAKGTLTCEIAMEWCVKTFWKYYPTLKPRDVGEEDAMKRGIAGVQAQLNNLLAFPPGKPRRFGEYPEGSWKNFVDVLYEGGEIKAPIADVNILYTNELIDEINNFDVAKVQEKAKTLK